MYRKEMLNHYIRLFVVTTVLILLQAVLLNHLRLFHYFLPIIYLYGFLKMPYQAQRSTLILSAAAVGFVLDLLMDTPGLNMAASTLTIYLRPTIFRTMTTVETIEDSDEALIPSARTIKFFPYLGYLLTLTLIHATTLMLLEALSVRLFVGVIPYILGTTVFSTALYLLFDALNFWKRDS